MANTYIPIAKSVLAADAAYSEITGIPSTYTDLLLLISGRDTDTNLYGDLQIKPNNLSTNQSNTILYGNGASAASTRDSIFGTYAYHSNTSGSNTANTFGSIEVYIPNYAGSTYKVISISGNMETNATTSFIASVASLWSNTSAITSIRIVPFSGNLKSGTRFDLYGIS